MPASAGWSYNHPNTQYIGEKQIEISLGWHKVFYACCKIEKLSDNLFRPTSTYKMQNLVKSPQQKFFEMLSLNSPHGQRLRETLLSKYPVQKENLNVLELQFWTNERIMNNLFYSTQANDKFKIISVEEEIKSKVELRMAASAA